MRVLGIDPGLTRCGLGIVDISPTRNATLVHVEVVYTRPDTDLEKRLWEISQRIAAVIDDFGPTAVAVERMFAQHNLRTVMGTAQASGVALQIAASRGLSVALRTPTEVKAAVTGYGSADKKQVGTMVARILRLPEPPRPADAADALAIAICEGWQISLPVSSQTTGGGTPAQRAWRAAEQATVGSRS